jgi:methionyl aminopeptidase
VPPNIGRPDYALLGSPATNTPKSYVKSPDLIERMRRAGKEARAILDGLDDLVRPGVRTDALDEWVHNETVRRGGYPSPLNYHGYPKSLCTSVNEVICHGIPDSRALEDGDIVNCDVTIFLDGVHGDCSKMFAVGRVDDEGRRLIDVTRQCLELGVEAVVPGRPISDIGTAIQRHAEGAGFGVVRDFVGHGVGEVFHERGLSILHYFDERASTIMEPGMTFTIEPMITEGDFRAVMWDDDWTAVTRDLSRSAQFEHTLLVTDSGPEILTGPLRYT